MKKNCITFFTLLSILFSPTLAQADGSSEAEECCEVEAVPSYFDDDEDLFNRGTLVGVEDDSWLRARRRQRYKNWGFALAATAAGVVTLIFSSK